MNKICLSKYLIKDIKASAIYSKTHCQYCDHQLNRRHNEVFVTDNHIGIKYFCGHCGEMVYISATTVDGSESQKRFQKLFKKLSKAFTS